MVRALHDYFRAAGFMVLEAKDGAEALQLFYENARRINIILLDVILADEPTGNLDRKTQRSSMSIFVNLVREKGKCIIIVTHSPDVANMADVKYVLSKRIDLITNLTVTVRLFLFMLRKMKTGIGCDTGKDYSVSTMLRATLTPLAEACERE